MTNTFSAIPTLYNGIRYRSRLEARWAAFFDALSWDHVYEPVDCLGYIPDFAIQFANPCTVECKPALDVAGMTDACVKIDRSGWRGDALVVGAQLWPEAIPHEQLAMRPLISCVHDGVFVPAPIARAEREGTTAINLGRFRHANTSTWVAAYLDCTRINTDVSDKSPIDTNVWSLTTACKALTPSQYMVARIAWADATNATQWMPGAHGTASHPSAIARDIIRAIDRRKRTSYAPPTYDVSEDFDDRWEAGEEPF